jgi:hypothetical protein
MAIPIISRREAASKNLKLYFTGNPCPRGHVAGRYVASKTCSECGRARSKTEHGREQARAWKQANPERQRQLNHKWCKAHPDRRREHARKSRDKNLERCREHIHKWRKGNPERRREAGLAWKQANRERAAEYNRKASRKWYLANTELHRERAREWRRNNLERDRALKQMRRARMRGAEGAHTAEDLRRIMKMQRGMCAICRVKLGASPHLDHIVPLKSRGSNWPGNLQWLCAPCNNRKRARDPMEFMQSLGLLL